MMRKVTVKMMGGMKMKVNKVQNLETILLADGDSELAFYRPNVGMIILNQENKVFVAQRIDSPGTAWQLPQGGIDEGEALEVAARRELVEETSITDVDFVAILPERDHWVIYDLPIDLQGKLWGGHYKGQRQKWFVFRYNGSDKDINLETEHPEFSTWKWADMSQLPDLAVDFKKDIYNFLKRQLGHLISQ